MSKIFKRTSSDLFIDRGTGTDFESRLSALPDYIVSNEKFFLRSHTPTPVIDAEKWRLVIDGSGIRHKTELTYSELNALPQTTIVRTIECAGNGRAFFKDAYGAEAEGGQWLTGAIGNAEWTGVRLRDVLQLAGVLEEASTVMPAALDQKGVSRPMPIEKAMREDTLLVLRMNGETLPPDHGFPARVLASGWAGAACIKWLGRIQVAQETLYSHYNTIEYVLTGPDYTPEGKAPGKQITEMPVTSMLDLDWPGKLRRKDNLLRGRAFAGESRVREVLCQIDGSEWRSAEILPPNIEGSWVRWQMPWDPKPGCHIVRTRAEDERGRAQPDGVPWNDRGYLYHGVIAHPVEVA